MIEADKPMIALRREKLIKRLLRVIIGLLDGKESWVKSVYEGKSLDGKKALWFLAAQRAGPYITLIETVLAPDGVSQVSWYWIFSPKNDKEWEIKRAEKNQNLLEENWINDELGEILERLEDSDKAEKTLEIPQKRGMSSLLPPLTLLPWMGQFRNLAGLSLLVLSAFFVFGIASLRYYQGGYSVHTLEKTIQNSSSEQSEAIQRFSEKMEAVDRSFTEFHQDMRNERLNFEFSREKTALFIRSQAESLPAHQFSRQRAYFHLADRIEFSRNYGELIDHLSQLPEDNRQAETFLALARENIVPLSSYRLTVPAFRYPVRLDAGPTNGQDFMISSGFGELRPTLIGSGGFLPHKGIDIINISNILTVTAGNSILRFPGKPGSVVAVDEGVILSNAYDNVYGWNLELSHQVGPVERQHYAGIEGLSSYYAHLKDNPRWKKGQRVAKGQKLGTIGQTGQTTGPHLHFEIRVYRDGGEFSNAYGSFDRVNPSVLISQTLAHKP